MQINEEYGKLQPIADAIEHLENLGDIKCNIPECQDVGCASVILWNALMEVLQKNPDLINS